MRAEIRLPDMGLNFATTQILLEVIGGWEYLVWDDVLKIRDLVREARKAARESNPRDDNPSL